MGELNAAPMEGSEGGTQEEGEAGGDGEGSREGCSHAESGSSTEGVSIESSSGERSDESRGHGAESSSLAGEGDYGGGNSSSSSSRSTGNAAPARKSEEIDPSVELDMRLFALASNARCVHDVCFRGMLRCCVWLSYGDVQREHACRAFSICVAS